MANPEIRIQHAYLLDPHFYSLFKFKQESGLIEGGRIYNSRDVILGKILEYEAAWKDQEQVLFFMQDVLCLNFYMDTIDVYVVGSMKGAISRPLLISSTVGVVDFLDILIHELLHNLIADSRQKIDVVDILSKLFPTESRLCKNHIVVHAMMTKIYTEFLKIPDRLRVIRERDADAPDYMRAWAIVDAEGAEAVLEKFRNFYKGIAA